MMCVIPFFAGDVGLAQELLKWCGDLGGCKEHPCLLVADAATPWDDVRKARALALEVFKSVLCITNRETVPGWIPGSSSLFKAAAMFCAGQAFMWVEPDAVPLRAGWLDELENHYRNCGKAFMGTVVRHDQPGIPNPYFEGCGVYPPDCWERMKQVWDPRYSWTRATYSVTIPQAAHTPLIHHLWGEVGRPPTFAEKNVPGTDVFCLAQLNASAVLFHRNKDGSLIRLLRRKMGLIKEPNPIEIATVFSFCGKDQHLMAKSMGWIADLGPKRKRLCVLHYDGTVGSPLRSIVDSASRAFSTVLTSRYPTPQNPFVGWPAACNWAFQQACRFVMQRIHGPWLWFEADAVAVKADWLEQIELEYVLGNKPFMGTQIGDFDGLQMGHINGTAVYPPDAPTYFPRALANIRYPWDAGMRDEMISFAHFSNRIMQHCGAVINGKCKPANGPKAIFRSQNDVDTLIDPEVVFFHPDKEGTLIDRLRERKSCASPS